MRPAWIETVRADLEREFAPRRRRALENWPVGLEDRQIADVSCLVASPKIRRQDGTLLYLFGGGYASGSPETDLPIIAPLAHLSGMQIIAPRYALAPEHPFPAALDQVTNVISDLAPAALCGESAGGGLALALLQRKVAPPRKLVLFSPWTDMTPDGIAACAGMNDPTMTTADLSQYARLYTKDPQDPSVSPFLAPLPDGLPPVFLTTCGRDILRPNVLALHEKLIDGGHPVTLLDMPDMCHVFEVYDEYAEALVSLTRAASFLTE